MTVGAPVSIADAAAFERWVASALPGEVAVYHVGRLAEDREGRPEIDRLARIALAAGRQRFVTLAQRRHDASRWEYRAIRTEYQIGNANWLRRDDRLDRLLDAIAACGSERKAAAALGMSRGALQRRLRPELRR